MTAVRQNFTIYAGDDAQPVFTVLNQAGAAIDISGCRDIAWIAQRDPSSAAAITCTKTGGQIEFVTSGADGKFAVSISAAQTASLAGYYLHKAVLTDSTGLVTTVSLGRMQIGRAPVWTYSGDPSLSPRDAVRNYIGDTDESAPQLYDPEIDAVLLTYPNPLMAAAQCCRYLAARYARKVSKQIGPLSVDYSKISEQYLAMADDLETKGVIGGTTPYAGGISKSDMSGVASNTDRVKPNFQVGQFDHTTSTEIQSPPDEEFVATP